MNPNYMLLGVGLLVFFDMVLTIFTYKSGNKQLKELEYVTERRIQKVRSHISSVQTNCRNENLNLLKEISELNSKLTERESTEFTDRLELRRQAYQAIEANKTAIDTLFKHATYEDAKKKKGIKKKKNGK